MRLTSLLILVVALGCTNPKPSLDGHWVSKEFFEGKPFFTFDFSPKDSILYINKNSIGPWGITCSYYGIDGYVEFFYGHDYITHKLILEDDSIYVSGADFNSVLTSPPAIPWSSSSTRRPTRCCARCRHGKCSPSPARWTGCTAF